MTESGSGRRDALKLIAVSAAVVAGAGSAVAAPASDAASVERAVVAALGSSDPAVLGAMLHDAALVIDHDVPYPLDRNSHLDHARFLAGLWERVEILFHQPQTVVHGETAIFSAYFIQRGKPRDAGFRLRPGYCHAVCARTSAGWRILGLHMSPLSAQIIDASPG